MQLPGENFKNGIQIFLAAMFPLLSAYYNFREYRLPALNKYASSFIQKMKSLKNKFEMTKGKIKDSSLYLFYFEKHSS